MNPETTLCFVQAQIVGLENPLYVNNVLTKIVAFRKSFIFEEGSDSHSSYFEHQYIYYIRW